MKKLKEYREIYLGLCFIIMGIYVPEAADLLWENMIVDIRSAIVSGDSAHLVFTTFIWSVLMLIQNVLVLNGVVLLTRRLIRSISEYNLFVFGCQSVIYSMVILVMNQYANNSTEIVSSIVAGVITIGLVHLFYREEPRFWQDSILYIQVIFAFEWLNIIPMMTRYGFGLTDIPASIKVASIYLGSESVLNLIGYAFFLTMMVSGLMTVAMFRIVERNITMAKENYEKEMALDAIRQKAINTRMHEEIHAITHDLKTPLVTIRGLNSLIAMSSGAEKIIEYTERIDNAATKMTDMISGFLYEAAKQVVTAESIIDYVRAQIPIENEGLEFTFNFGVDLPRLHVNKVRVSRAMINIIENAIIVPTNFPTKKIQINTYRAGDDLVLEVIDNGVGISETRMQHIWEIGYSSKETTGLGLAFVKQVIADNGGEVTIKSVVDRGTIVKILLPMAEDIEEDEA